MGRVVGQGVVLNRSSRCIRVTAVLAVVAITIAGCADSRMAATNATTGTGTPASTEAAQKERPYKTAYGISSDGPTTDLYTELFGPSRRDDRNAAATMPATASVTTQPIQPVTASAATQSVQPAAASAATRPVQPAMASAATRQVQPAPAAEVRQPPTTPQPPPEPDVPTAYGITSNGPTTDLYTELFGPRRRDGQ
jgi:hypothetical protein